jgi:hypothetical protein
MNRLPLAALAAAALAVAACNAAEPGGIAPTIAPGLELPAGTVPQAIRLDRKFDDPLALHLHGDPYERTINAANCADYEKVRTRVDGSDSSLNYEVVKYQGASCDGLALMRRAVASPQSALPPGEFLTWRSSDLFPGSLWSAFSDDEIASLASPKATLKTASGKASMKNVQGKFLELEDAGGGVHLTLLGLGDIDHDGWQDAVVLVEGYAKGGSNRTARAAVLTRRTGEVRLHEVSIDGLLQ